MLALLAATMLMMQDIDATGTAVARPIGTAKLEPISGSYFQIFEFYGRPPHTWRHARRMVKGYLHEGREGRLAQVKDGATHYFLVLNFDMLRERSMWIGLSAECLEKAELKWIDGTPLEAGSFRAWANTAQKSIRDTCTRNRGRGTVLPIFYESSEFTGVRWQMGQPNTNIMHMMVEFPVPEADEDAAEGGR